MLYFSQANEEMEGVVHTAKHIVFGSTCRQGHGNLTNWTKSSQTCFWALTTDKGAYSVTHP